MTVPRVSITMGPNRKSLRDKFFPALFGGEYINANFWKILGHIVNHGGLSIPDPQLSADSTYNTSKSASGELVDSLPGGSALRACVRRAIAVASKERNQIGMADLARQKELLGGQ